MQSESCQIIGVSLLVLCSNWQGNASVNEKPENGLLFYVNYVSKWPENGITELSMI